MGQQRYFNYGATGVAELLKGFTAGALTAGVYEGFNFELVDGDEGRFRLTPGYVLIDHAETLTDTERTLRRAVMIYEDEPVPLSLGWGAVPPSAVWYTVYITHSDQDITGGVEADWHVHEHTALDSPPGPWSQDDLNAQLEDDEAAVIVGWIYFPGAVSLDSFMWASVRPRKPNAWTDDSERLAPDHMSYQLLTENNGTHEVEVVDSYGDVRTKLTAGSLDADWLFQAFVPPTRRPAFPYLAHLWTEVPSLCSVRLQAYPPGWVEMSSTLLGATNAVVSLNSAQQQTDGYYDGWRIEIPSVSASRRVRSYTALTNSVELDAPISVPTIGDAYTLTPVPVFDQFVSNVDWDRHGFALSYDALLLHKLMIHADWNREVPGLHTGAEPRWVPCPANPTDDNIWGRYWSILIAVTSVPNTTVRLGPLSLEKAYRLGS